MSKQKIIPKTTAWYWAIRVSLIKWFGSKCGSCGKKLTRRTAQFGHLHGKPTGLDGRGRGSWNRIHDIMKNPTHYFLGCVKCHEEYDRKNGDWRGQKNGN